MMLLLPLSVILLLYPELSDGLTCHVCNAVTSPHQCNATTTCGINDMCYTEEYTDSRGAQAFRLRCASKTTCTLLQKVTSGSSKRAGAQARCYECCSTDGCNRDQCLGFVGSQKYQLTMDECTGCPERYVPFQDHCYLFVPGLPTHPEAKDYCDNQGARVLSIKSDAEKDFIVQTLDYLHDNMTQVYWTGASYEHRRWIWSDGSLIQNSSIWRHGYPPDQGRFISGPIAVLYYPLFDFNTHRNTLQLDVVFGGTPSGNICKRPRAKARALN